MSVLVVIPARYASSRYPGKPLVPLTGTDGTKTLIHRSWEAARTASLADRVVVATDDDRIRQHALGFGAEVVMTSTEARNGTERCAEVITQLSGDDIVVNFQGDALLTPGSFVDALVAALQADGAADLATPVLRCDSETLAALTGDRAAGRVGGTTAVFDSAGHALYFSKEVIPFTPQPFAAGALIPVFHHVGLYAYRPAVLAAYPRWPIGPLEQLEGLEQLRFLENGKRVRCVEVEAAGRRFWELNNPSDVARIEAILAAPAE